MKTMLLCCCRASGLDSVVLYSEVGVEAKLFLGLEPEIRPRFCSVKLRIAGLGLWRWRGCAETVRGESVAGAGGGVAAGLWRRRLMGVTS